MISLKTFFNVIISPSAKVKDILLAEVDIFETMSGSYPVLLLDDIFSEFDLKKQNKLLKLINSKNIQSILTTTNLKGINKKYLDDSYIYKVENGKIERK